MFLPSDTVARGQRVFRRFATAAVAASVLVNACDGTSERAPAPSVVNDGAGGTRATGNAGAGADREPVGGAGGQGGAQAELGGGAGGQARQPAGAPPGTAGAEDATGAAGGAQAGSAATAGGANTAPPPVPLCKREGFREGTRLSLSTPDDDVLEAVTPDALTLVFESGTHFYAAERATESAAFDDPVEVAAGLGFGSVTLSSDGLTLVGSTAAGFVALTRLARGDAFGADPDDSSFLRFNAAVLGNPTNEVALEPLFGMSDTVLLYSFVSPSNDDDRPTLFASEWLGEWPFGQALPGEKRLWAHGQRRRVATGLSSDGLTLFYRDEVAGEFRSAWRERLGDEFDAFESLGDWVSAAPNGDCTALYYSEDGGDGTGVDVFVASP